MPESLYARRLRGPNVIQLSQQPERKEEDPQAGDPFPSAVNQLLAKSLMDPQQGQGGGSQPSISDLLRMRNLSKGGGIEPGSSTFVGAPAGSAAYGPLMGESAAPFITPAAGGASGTNIAGSAGPLTMDAVFPAGGAAAGEGGFLGSLGAAGGGGLAGLLGTLGFGAVAAGLPISLWHAYSEKGDNAKRDEIKANGWNGLEGDAAWEAYKDQKNAENSQALAINEKVTRGLPLTPEEQALWGRYQSRFLNRETGD